MNATGSGIHTIDTGFQRERFDAAYLVVENGRGAFIDTGTNFGVPRLLATLDGAGLAPADVEWLIVTHVHLDHAGGAGLLMQSLPNATLVVHPRGARHMIDPAALVAGATAVYGEAEMARSYGTVVPVDAARVRETHDGMRLTLGGTRTLEFIDTPGHARHHHCIWDERSRAWFTGDTAGIAYPELETEQGSFIFPTSTPVQFEPDVLEGSIARLLERRPERLHLTHFGPVGRDAEDVQRLGERLLDFMREMVALALAVPGRGAERHAGLKQAFAAQFVRRLQAQGCRLGEARMLELLAIDIELNAQGVAVWLDRRAGPQGR